MKNLLFVFCFILAILSFDKSSSVYGQCPDGTWTDGGCINTVIDGCDVEVCYCFRVLMSGSTVLHYDYHVYKVTLLEDCGTFTWEDVPYLYDQASVKLVFLNPEGFPCPPCPSYNFKYRSWKSECMKIISGEDISVQLSDVMVSADYITTNDCGDLNMCLQGYAVCCDPISGIPTVVTYGAKVVDEGEDECTGEYPVEGWVPTNTCFKIVYCE